MILNFRQNFWFFAELTKFWNKFPKDITFTADCRLGCGDPFAVLSGKVSLFGGIWPKFFDP